MAKPLSVNQLCAQLEVIKMPSIQGISAVMRKLAMLQSLAQMLENAGDLIGLPDISSLIPVSSIDAGSYEQIRSSCINPATGIPLLPDLNSNPTGVTDMQGYVSEGYQKLYDLLESHPHRAMGCLQTQIDALIGQAQGYMDQSLGAGLNVFDCLDSLCSSAKNLPSSASRFEEEGKRLESEFNQFTDDGSNILDANKEAKAQLVDQYRVELKNYMDWPAPPIPTPPIVPIPTP